jgi:hypothetical protein
MGDLREFDARNPGDERPRVYDPRDRDPYDPREALMRDLDTNRFVFLYVVNRRLPMARSSTLRRSTSRPTVANATSCARN